jgi:hypothetical protein
LKRDGTGRRAVSVISVIIIGIRPEELSRVRGNS